MDWLPIVERLGLPLAIFIVLGWAGYKEIWKWGSDYRKQQEQHERELADVKAQRDKKEAQIDRLVELGFKAASLAESQAKSISGPQTRTLKSKDTEGG